jgi:hypothetical protein
MDAPEKSIVGCTDTTAPTVESVRPSGKKVTPRVNITVTFSEPMERGTITGITLKLFKKNSTIAIPAMVTYNATKKTAILNPNTNLRRVMAYRAIVAAEVADLARFSASFHIGPRKRVKPKDWHRGG